MNIIACNIRKSYGKLIVLDDFNIEIKQGDFLGIYGKSGSGKTTLLNILGGLEEADAGYVKYDNNILKNRILRKLRRENISYIFQNFGLVDNLTVLENLKTLYNFKDLTKNDEHIKILDNLKIVDKLNSKVYELSGGEQQRVALAKAQLKVPSIIFADEPTASVDVDNRDMILNELIEMNRQGTTVVLVSHDPVVINKCVKQVKL